MLEKFRGTNEAEPRKQCESLARARVAFSMFLATLIHIRAVRRSKLVEGPSLMDLKNIGGAR